MHCQRLGGRAQADSQVKLSELLPSFQFIFQFIFLSTHISNGISISISIYSSYTSIYLKQNCAVKYIFPQSSQGMCKEEGDQETEPG